jgi:hypothetical protein
MALPTVMFIRHAEKPEKSEKGVTRAGEPDEHSLSVRGWTRAGALAAFFSRNLSDSPATTPGRVIATKPSADYKSKREHDTAVPTAHRLGLDIESVNIPGHYDHLATDIQHAGIPTLVVWHHGSIPSFVSAFPVSNSDDVPNSWPDDRFDVIWVLMDAGDHYLWHQMEQRLLEGDALD